MEDLIVKIIRLYRDIQRIPVYFLVERDPSRLLEIKKGSCLEKNTFLGKEYEKLGIPVKYLMIKFDWRKLPIPEEIIEKRDNTLGEHLALKIQINDKWIFVDSTWDPPLEKAGFLITKDWDGKSDTKLAIKPLAITELEKPPTKGTVTTNSEFFNLLNGYLTKLRET